MLNDSFAARIAQLPQTDKQTEPEIIKARQKYRRSHFYWSAEEDDILAELVQHQISASDMSQWLERSAGAIEARIRRTVESTTKLRSNSDKPIEKPIAAIDFSTRDPILNLLGYWRSSLLDEAKIGLSFSSMTKGDKCSLEQIKQGRLPQKLIMPLFIQAEQQLKKKQDKKIDSEVTLEKIQIIIAPYTAIKKYDHGNALGANSQNAFFPLWLTADLTREGILVPTEELCYPWIERQCLTPNEQKNSKIDFPIIGDISDVDFFYEREVNDLELQKDNWSVFFNFAFNLLQALCKNNHNLFTEQNVELIEEGYFIPFLKINDSAKHIVTTYDQYLANAERPLPPLLRQFCSLTNPPAYADKSWPELLLANQHHLGQMEKAYPLSKTQRTSLNYFVDAEHNNIFTIHGPPGTGKTTLLLSVIASEWVKAALEQAMPPIIVAASANNQAVTNILDAFNKANTTNKRWLPELSSFGTYLCSADKAKKITAKYLYQLKNGTGAITNFHTPEYRAGASQYFLSQFNHHFKKNEQEIEPCKQYIHACMVEKKQLLMQTLDLMNDYRCLQDSIAPYGDNIERITHLIAQSAAEQTKLESALFDVKELRSQWMTYQYSTLKWLQLMQWLPFIKTLLQGKIKLFSANHHSFFPEVLDCPAQIDAFFEQQLTVKNAALQHNKILLDEYNSIHRAYEHCMHTCSDLEKALGFKLRLDLNDDYSAPEHINCLLDKSLRYDLFILASHYWEARWLLDSPRRHSLTKNRDDQRVYWQIQAMLTPCSVTTLYMCPSFFSYLTVEKKFETLDDFIDLLIIDEAGQVLPSLAGAAISTAKRMLLVGDAKQIEPVFKLPEHIDMANAKKYALCHDEQGYGQLKNLGVLCSGNRFNNHSYGNTIILSQHKAKYHLTDHKVPGMLLKEHRRCPKDIISYCNELCYDNSLIPLTDEQPSSFPRMGYAHIKGHVEQQGGSRYNKQEARVIANWLAKNKDKITADCGGRPLSDCVAVVTPFAAQKRELEDALREQHIELAQIGTIHSLQGAEKDFVILSTVYTAGKTGENLFFDQSPNMLNVAVSRAKRSFLVFGDMDIFDSQQHHPSSLLAKYLFAQESNEITDILTPEFNQVKTKPIKAINTLDKHREALTHSFVKAQHELNIVTPFLRMKAVRDDNIPQLVQQYAPYIAINIYTDPSLNIDTIEKRKEFYEVISLLRNSGAHVFLAKQVHSKIITVDDKVLIIGSFNWLSATRDPRYKREESSVIYIGDEVFELIETLMVPIKDKASLTLA